MYKLKYLKYKKKYLNLKNNLKGGNNDLQQNNIFDLVKMGDINQVQNLINNNPDIVNQTNDNGKTPLFIAVEKFNIPMINLLIEKGADINIVNTEGDNILFELFKNLTHILTSNNFDDEQLSSIISKVVEIINIFKQQYNPPFNFMIKNLENQNLLQVATFAITYGDKKLNKNLSEEDVENNIYWQNRLKMYDYIIKSLIFNNESITDEDGPDGQPGMSAPMHTLNKGYIGNFINNIFNKYLKKRLINKIR